MIVAVALLSLWPGMRRRPWLIGVASFGALLLPVLPLSHHAYHYYLYGALPGAGLCVGALIDSLANPETRQAKGAAAAHAKPWPSTLSWAIAAVCSLALTWNGARLVKRIAEQPAPGYPVLHADPIVDLSLIAERAMKSLRAAALPRGTQLVFILRDRAALLARIAAGSKEAMPPPRETYTEANVRVALDDGLGVRAVLPAVDSVSFVTSLVRLTPAQRYAVYATTGTAEVFSGAAMDSVLRRSWIRP